MWPDMGEGRRCGNGDESGHESGGGDASVGVFHRGFPFQRIRVFGRPGGIIFSPRFDVM
jgi:hypothetical protein